MKKWLIVAGALASAGLFAYPASAEPVVWGIQAEQFEYRVGEGSDIYAWDAGAFVGAECCTAAATVDFFTASTGRAVGLGWSTRDPGCLRNDSSSREIGAASSRVFLGPIINLPHSTRQNVQPAAMRTLLTELGRHARRQTALLPCGQPMPPPLLLH